MTIWPESLAGRADFRRYRDGPEKRLQAYCRRAAVLQGYRPWHLAQARASAQSAGLPDDLITGAAVLLAVEYKAGRNRQTPAQRAFQAAWEASGGVYVLVWTLADFLEALDAHPIAR